MTEGEDFTEASYRSIVEKAAESHRFEPFGTTAGKPHVLWRHDLDSSVHRALALARIEADIGVRATYFFLLHGWMYNILEREILDKAKEIARLGHWIGLHFDTSFYAGMETEEDLAVPLERERDLLAEIVEEPVEAYSFHNPDQGPALGFDSDSVAGMVNAYGRGLRERYSYVSDSNGYWRHRSLPEVLDGGESLLHVLTHPEWWQREPMTPRERFQRCVDGRARNSERLYASALEQAGRENVG